jgi:3-carboxy-cis,cis-muconate cycloisomerase
LRLDELLDPANYLGQSAEIARRILAGFPDFAPAHPGSADTLSTTGNASSTDPDQNGANRG